MDTLTVGVHAPPERRSPPIGWIGAAVFVGLLGALAVVTTVRNGSFTYPLDDAYIHLRLADNLRSGTLGLNPGEFASAGSSPLWPLVLVVPTAVLGPLAGIPFALNLVIGVVLLVGLDAWARRNFLSTKQRWLLQAGMLVLVPLPVVAFTGMEHVLQILAVLLVAGLVIGNLVDDRADLRADLWIGAAALLAAAVRFDVVFVLVPLGLLMLLARRWRALAFAVVGAAIPALATVALNLGQGWPAFPASVTMKSIANDSSTGLIRLLPGSPELSAFQPRILGVLAVVCVLWWSGRASDSPRWRRLSDRWTFVAVSVAVLHYGYLNVPGTFRYEAYVVALGVVAATVNLHTTSLREAGGRTLPTAARYLAVASLALAMLSGATMYRDVATASGEIHDQHIQMAAFVRSACPDCSIVANDIGILAMYSGAVILDDFGLADERVLRHKLAGTWDVDQLDALGNDHDATMAVVYDTPFWLPGVPAGWERLGTWTIPTGVVVGGRTVSFYSLDPERTEALRDQFAEFDLPDGVEVTVDGR